MYFIFWNVVYKKSNSNFLLFEMGMFCTLKNDWKSITKSWIRINWENYIFEYKHKKLSLKKYKCVLFDFLFLFFWFGYACFNIFSNSNIILSEGFKKIFGNHSFENVYSNILVKCSSNDIIAQYVIIFWFERFKQ